MLDIGNISQEINSKSKRKRLIEKWKTNVELEARTHLQNLMTWRPVRTFQVSRGEEYP
jgi:hypothetical protein